MELHFNLITFLKHQQRRLSQDSGEKPKTESTLTAINKGLQNIKKNPGNATAWANVVYLTCEGAQRRGISALDIATALENQLKG